LDRQVVLPDSTQFLNGHLEATVSYDGHYSTVRSSHLRANGCRQSKSHRAKTSTRHPAVRHQVVIISHRKHLMLTHIWNDDGFTFGFLIDDAHQFTHSWAARCRIQLIFDDGIIFLFVTIPE